MLVGELGFSNRVDTYEAHSIEVCGINRVITIERNGYVMFCCKCMAPLIQVKRCRFGKPETTGCVCPNTMPFNKTFTENEISTVDEQSNTSVRNNTDCPPSTSISDDDEAEVDIFAEIEIKLSELQKELRELKKSPPINCECVSTAAIVMICLMLFIGPFVALISYHHICQRIIHKPRNLPAVHKLESSDAVSSSDGEDLQEVISQNGQRGQAKRRLDEARKQIKPKPKSNRRGRNSRSY
uniref:uncharacterized protein LOC120347960 n=1 Tax=Styela clava TaxID=7725 RepID=UPI0019394B3C|nr:uncharacterized protein LOC120347960 [Styela clava]